MSIALMTEAWKAELPSGRKFVLLSLCDNANDQGECYPSIAMIAKRCSMSVRAVQGHILALESDGVVVRVERIVFPTHVGVFLKRTKGGSVSKGLPHARGGVSDDGSCIERGRGSSPRTWGCFQRSLRDRAVVSVFPTHVGVFLALWPTWGAYHCLPHARGGVS